MFSSQVKLPIVTSFLERKVRLCIDELLRAHHEARSELRRLDDDEPEEIEEFREKERAAGEGRNVDRSVPAEDMT